MKLRYPKTHERAGKLRVFIKRLEPGAGLSKSSRGGRGRKLQKTVRDRLENIPVTNIYFGLAWTSLTGSLVLLAIGLWKATILTLSEKGFFGMAYALSLFAAVAVQKNVRDLAAFEAANPTSTPASKSESDEGGFFNLGGKK